MHSLSGYIWAEVACSSLLVREASGKPAGYKCPRPEYSSPDHRYGSRRRAMNA